MKRSFILFAIFLFSFSLLAPNAAMSRGRDSKKHQGKKGMVPYKQETFKTVTGEVNGVKTVFNRIQQEKGLHLVIETSSGEFIVHVCPQWYADKKKIRFEVGESVTISGSTFMKDGKQNIYAATIVRGSVETLKLRDPDSGHGLWRGRYQDEKRKKNRHDRMRKNRDKGWFD